MALVLKRSRYAINDLLVLLNDGVEDFENLTVTTSILYLGFYREWKHPQHGITPLAQILCAMEFTAGGTVDFDHWWDVEDVLLEEFEVLGSVQGALDVCDPLACRRYLRDVASKIDHLFAFDILSEDES